MASFECLQSPTIITVVSKTGRQFTVEQASETETEKIESNIQLDRNNIYYNISSQNYLKYVPSS